MVMISGRSSRVVGSPPESWMLHPPVLSRSIYEVAQQIIASGAYPAGSAVHTFVTGLIADADALEG